MRAARCRGILTSQSRGKPGPRAVALVGSKKSKYPFSFWPNIRPERTSPPTRGTCSRLAPSDADTDPPRSIPHPYAGLEPSAQPSADHLGCSPAPYSPRSFSCSPADGNGTVRSRSSGALCHCPHPAGRRPASAAPIRRSGLHCSTPVRLLQSNYSL